MTIENEYIFLTCCRNMKKNLDCFHYYNRKDPYAGLGMKKGAVGFNSGGYNSDYISIDCCPWCGTKLKVKEKKYRVKQIRSPPFYYCTLCEFKSLNNKEEKEHFINTGHGCFGRKENKERRTLIGTKVVK